MKQIFIAVLSIILFTSCGNDKVILPTAVGSFGKVLVVVDNSKWEGDIGNEIRTSFGKLQVGLPQPEKTLSVAQVAPKGFRSMLKTTRNILVLQIGDTMAIKKVKNRFAQGQSLVYISATSEEELMTVLKENAQDLIDTYRSSDVNYLQGVFRSKRLDDSQYKTLQNLNISLTVPENYRTVDDTGDFLWLRHHLKSGIARGAGNNNILVYSLPLSKQNSIADSIISMRDAIGEKYIPGSKEGMYMITEAAYTPFTVETTIEDKMAYETRGKWEVKNDFMAGPFLNYAIVDEEHDRLLVVEGFTYAPSVDKRNFLLELEAIAKSVQIR
jgi:hypothetical protein